jgi:hypothetical protein
MRPNYVPLAIKNAGVELEVIVPEVLRRPVELPHYVRISKHYRRIASGILLASGHPRGFFENLFNSSRAFLYFLAKAADAQKVTSNAEAFFDAVACQDEYGAREMARLSPQEINRGKEYEEDFIYVSLLMKRFYLGADPADLRSMLDEWGSYAVDNPDARLDVCRALVDGDAAAFDEAISAAIQAKLDAWEQLRKSEMLHPDEASTTCHVNTEVLAWVEFADRVGLKVEPEYRLAPNLARRFELIAFPDEDAWQRPSGFASLKK